MPANYLQRMYQTSHLSGTSANYVENLYEQYVVDKFSVPSQWRDYFDAYLTSDQLLHKMPHSLIRSEFLKLANAKPFFLTNQIDQSNNGVSLVQQSKQIAVIELINAYRVRGHQQARIDPLGLTRRTDVPDLKLNFHGLSNIDLESEFQTKTTFFDQPSATLKKIIETLEKTYCGSIGAEFMHIVDSEETSWFQQRLETVQSHPDIDQHTKQNILERLTAAEGLEKYLDSKYPGTKRFGLEGGESLILVLDQLIEKAGTHQTKEIVIGMAHRGRLNVLINILGKKSSDLVEEFDGTSKYAVGSGDVKYHQGFSSNLMTSAGEVHLALAFNPSHLEIVAPVVEGSVRARQDKRKDQTGDSVLPIVIHGDAAFSGQGVVMETLQMSQTRAYKTGGTIHIIINNQVGFTTNKKEDARSTEYCSDVAKVVEAPVLHVNSDDPEAVLYVSQLAIDYRNHFHKDIVIDLVCYRRRGHNEADEPSGTQPLMYQTIKTLPSVLTQYSKLLVQQGVVNESEVKRLSTEYRNKLVAGENVVNNLVSTPDNRLHFDWTPYFGHDWTSAADTGYEQSALVELAIELNNVPTGLSLQRQVKKVISDRLLMAKGEQPINWGFAETLAYATILKQGYSVRITGQDSGRGTFSHRHAVLHDQNTGESYIPHQHLTGIDRRFALYDSFLSELAVLGFEYGYATTNPKTMVIWEAQFGDFANGAQMIIDQFITSGEHKWGRLCGLTLLLPHGYEGQGPEHSSARLERFLQMCAENNIQVCVPTTPAQIYHLLRRQIIRPLRRPLIVMSPKSLLRHKLAVSSMHELANGTFKNVIAEIETHTADTIERLIICSGRVYYDLIEKRKQLGVSNIAIVRLEQLYPFPERELADTIALYKNIKKVVWCQEEPKNQGAWYSTQHHIRDIIKQHDKNLNLEYAGREASAAPAAGYMELHLKQLEKFINHAITG